jgi:hypothetical protein
MLSTAFVSFSWNSYDHAFVIGAPHHDGGAAE